MTTTLPPTRPGDVLLAAAGLSGTAAETKPVTMALHQAASWARLAIFVAENPSLRVTCPPSSHCLLANLSDTPDPVGAIADVARHAVQAGATVEVFSDHASAGIYAWFGTAYLMVFTWKCWAGDVESYFARELGDLLADQDGGAR